MLDSTESGSGCRRDGVGDRPYAASGERATAADLAMHGLGVTDVMIAFGGTAVILK
ncbi:hypothetical protein K1Y78_34170 [Streptomyces sp. tea 10]|nr:hypothetical protein [Streptomyces sp. tea 10]